MRILLVSFLLLAVHLGCSSHVSQIDSVLKVNFEAASSIDSLFNKMNGRMDTTVYYSGKTSLVSEKENLILSLNTKLEAKKLYKVSYWKKGKAAQLEVVLKGDQDVKLKERLSYYSKGDWDKVELLIGTGWYDSTIVAEIKITNPSKKEIHIDDFEIREINVESDYTFEISKKRKKKIITCRNKAAKSSFIKPKFKQKVKAELNGKPVKFKLKGDWTDHVLTGIWSFKTYGKTDIAEGTKNFTFQNLKTRNLLKEWVFINLCNNAGIVTPHYEPTTVSINGASPYICAMEEDFSNDFIKRKRGYQAPVLRLYEDFLFPHWVDGWKGGTAKIPELENSFIYSYEEGKYAKGKDYELFQEHGQKLYQLIKGDSIIHLVDMEKWASFFAIQSLTKSYHNLTWHNTRMFVNDKGLIEPIAYDGNTHKGTAENWFKGGIYGDLNKYLKKGPTVAITFTNKLFMSEEFMKVYRKKLADYSSVDFIQKEVEKFQVEYAQVLKEVQAFYEYDLDLKYLDQSAIKLKKSIEGLDNSNWVGKELWFNAKFSLGTAPANKLYVENIVRAYVIDDSLLIVNGTEETITLNLSDGNELDIQGTSSLTLVAKKELELSVEVEGKKIMIPVLPWIPLN